MSNDDINKIIQYTNVVTSKISRSERVNVDNVLKANSKHVTVTW